MKNKIKDLFNATKYKRKLNKMKNNYDEALESKLKDKEKIEYLQDQLLAAKDKILKLELELDYFKRKYEKKEVKKK